MDDEEEEGGEMRPSEKKLVWQCEVQPDSELWDPGEASDSCDDVTNIANLSSACCDEYTCFPRNNGDCTENEKPIDDLVVETINFSADDSHHKDLPVPRKLKLEREPKEMEKVGEKEMLLEDAEVSELLDTIEKGEDVSKGKAAKKSDVSQDSFLEDAEDSELLERAELKVNCEEKGDDANEIENIVNEKEECSFQCLEFDSTDNFPEERNEDFSPGLAKVIIEHEADKKVGNELKSQADRNDNPTRIPGCDLYSSWKREKSLCEKWQEEVESEVFMEMEMRDLREKERAIVLEFAKEKRSEILELGDVSIKESVVELSLEMEQTYQQEEKKEKEEEEEEEEEDIERMIKEEMMEENNIRDSKILKEKSRIVEEPKIKIEVVTEEERVIKEEMQEMGEEETAVVARQIECKYCKQKEGEVRP